MSVFLALFFFLGKNIRKNIGRIEVTGILFAASILFWCGGISLLDQKSTGQIIVYTAAVFCIAAVPLYRPRMVLALYLCADCAFIAALPFYSAHPGYIFGNAINATCFSVISLFISLMRYKDRIRAFNNTIIIEQKSTELERMNIELEIANKKLQKLSQRDGLTGIYNRFMFDRTIESEWDRCRRQFSPLSFIMIDIDHYKLYNDTYGHQAGDECLKKVAELLLRCPKRSSDTVARYGGEEFAVILPCTPKSGAAALAEHIRTEVERLAIPHKASDISDFVTVSIGVNTVMPGVATQRDIVRSITWPAVFQTRTRQSDEPREGMSSIDELIAGADKALYLAKQRRNAVVVA